jgi:hypothetical protein
MKLNKFLLFLMFLGALPVFCEDSELESSLKRNYRFAPYPDPKKIVKMKKLAALNGACSKTIVRTLGRKPSNEEKAAAAALALVLDNDPLSI